MLWTISLMLPMFWALGLITSYTLSFELAELLLQSRLMSVEDSESTASRRLLLDGPHAATPREACTAVRCQDKHRVLSRAVLPPVCQRTSLPPNEAGVSSRSSPQDALRSTCSTTLRSHPTV
jgi:hypothetical protein